MVILLLKTRWFNILLSVLPVMDPSFGSNPVKSMDRCRETRLCSVNLVVNNYSRVFIQCFKTSVVVKQYNRPLTNTNNLVYLYDKYKQQYEYKKMNIPDKTTRTRVSCFRQTTRGLIVSQSGCLCLQCPSRTPEVSLWLLVPVPHATTALRGSLRSLCPRRHRCDSSNVRNICVPPLE